MAKGKAKKKSIRPQKRRSAYHKMTSEEITAARAKIGGSKEPQKAEYKGKLCDEPGCNNKAEGICSDCKRSFCSKHLQPTLVSVEKYMRHVTSEGIQKSDMDNLGWKYEQYVDWKKKNTIERESGHPCFEFTSKVFDKAQKENDQIWENARKAMDRLHPLSQGLTDTTSSFWHKSYNTSPKSLRNASQGMATDVTTQEEKAVLKFRASIRKLENADTVSYRLRALNEIAECINSFDPKYISNQERKIISDALKDKSFTDEELARLKPLIEYIKNNKSKFSSARTEINEDKDYKMSFLCKIGLHKWGRSKFWMSASSNVRDWKKVCQRCGKTKTWVQAR